MNEKEKITVRIPEGYHDMNNGLPPEQPKPYIPEFLPMPQDIFDDLPPHLREACEQFTEGQEQEVFLMGALGVLSGILPNVHGIYDGQTVHPNLYCFVIGKYGTGKGALIWAKRMAEATDRYRTQQATEAMQQYEQEELIYNKQVRLYDKGKLQNPPQPPRKPRHLKLFLPANSTKTAVMQLLKENDGRGIIFETEGDTLADMLKQDYGNFSDVLRKAYHHEPVSYFRRANNEDVSIDRPELSVVLSGTNDQLTRLIPSIENGLFSRFLFYILEGKAPFRDPFQQHLSDREAYFQQLGDAFLRMYRSLEQSNETIWFRISDAQHQRFVSLFAELKTEIQDQVSEDLDGTINRLALITYRIAMILSSVRFLAGGKAHPDLQCLEMDFNNAIAITQHLLHYSMYIYGQLQERAKKQKVEISQIDMSDKQQLIEEACRCKDMGFSYKEIAMRVLGAETKKSTVWGWVNRFCGNKAG